MTMTATESLVDRRSAVASVAAGVLMAVSIGAELVRPVQKPDGDVLQPAVFGLYVASFVAGAAYLVRAVAGMPRAARAERVGRGLSLTGAVLLGATSAVNSGSRKLEGLSRVAGILADAFAALPGALPAPISAKNRDGCLTAWPEWRAHVSESERCARVIAT